MTTINERLDYGNNSLTVSIRGALCVDVAPFLAKHDVLEALEIVIGKSPDDYLALRPNKNEIIFGRRDDQGTMPDW